MIITTGGKETHLCLGLCMFFIIVTFLLDCSFCDLSSVLTGECLGVCLKHCMYKCAIQKTEITTKKE